MNAIYNGCKRFICMLLAAAIFTAVFPPITKAESFLAMVTSSKINVYSTSSMSTKIGTLSKYSIVDVLYYQGSVARIQKGNNIGYA